MEAINIVALEEAIKIFYRSGAGTSQATAHDWLTKAQCSQQAWSFVWELMRLDKSQELQFYGATTLHSKIMKYWHEVPEENHNELKEKLLTYIVSFSNGPKIVLNRLCNSLAAFICHMLKKWPNAIKDIVQLFKNESVPNLNGNMQIWIMFEVLCSIQEEGNVIYLSVQRAILRQEIHKNIELVLTTVEQYIASKCDSDDLDAESRETLLRATKCASIWLKNGGYPLDRCQCLATSLLKLINKCYWKSAQKDDGCMLPDEIELAEQCVDTLTAMMVQKDSNRYSNTALILLNLFLDYLSQITKAEWKENNSNEDIALEIYSLLITSIEGHLRVLLLGVLQDNRSHNELYMRLLHEILQCTDKPGIYPVEESCSTIAFGFWFMLQDHILGFDNIDKQKSAEILVPLYSHLTRILIRKAKQPDEVCIGKWSSDDLESFRCYRQDIADTMLYCQLVLNDNLLNILAAVLDESILAVQNNPQNWTPLEASLFAFYAIAERIERSENKHVPKLIVLLTELPYENLNEKILCISLETMGAYYEWFKGNPTYLPSVTELLVKGLSSSMAAQATLGLKDICRECAYHMHSFAEPLLERCEQVIANGTLKNSETIRLMFSIGKIMCLLPNEKIIPHFDILMTPCFIELRHLIETKNKTDSASIRTTFRLNMISTIFSSYSLTSPQLDGQYQEDTAPTVDVNKPVLYVMCQSMPIFKEIALMWIDNQSTLEALCLAIKNAMTNLNNDFRVLLPDVCGLILSILKSRCVPAIFDITKTAIISFYNDEQCQMTMKQLFTEVTNSNFKLFFETTNFSDVADILEAFYGFNAQIVKKLPMIYFETQPDCDKLLMYALRAMQLPETGPVKYSISFVSHFILQSRIYQNMTKSVLTNGQEIVTNIILCIAMYTPRTHIDSFSEIFVSLNKKYPSELALWMKVLTVPDFPNSAVAVKEKEFFIKGVIRERVNKRVIAGFIREFAEKSRDSVIEKHL